MGKDFKYINNENLQTEWFKNITARKAVSLLQRENTHLRRVIKNLQKDRSRTVMALENTKLKNKIKYLESELKNKTISRDAWKRKAESASQ